MGQFMSVFFRDYIGQFMWDMVRNCIDWFSGEVAHISVNAMEQYW